MGVYKNNSGTLDLLAGGTLYADAPVGSIQAYGGSSAPWGWLLCQGQAVSRATYAELFNVIGTSFGSGDGSTTFNIPDLRGEFLRGSGANSHSGQGDGGTIGQHQNATIIPNSGFATNSNNIRVYGYTSTNSITTIASNFDKVLYASTTGIETTTSSNLNRFTATNDVASGTVRPTNTSVNFIIKATTIALPSDFLNEIEEMFSYKDFDGMKYRIVGKSFDAFGYIANTKTNQGVTLQLPVTMQDTDYAVVITNNTTTPSAVSGSTFTVAKTTTSLRVGIYGTNGPIAYQIKGIIA